MVTPMISQQALDASIAKMKAELSAMVYGYGEGVIYVQYRDAKIADAYANLSEALDALAESAVACELRAESALDAVYIVNEADYLSDQNYVQ